MKEQDNQELVRSKTKQVLETTSAGASSETASEIKYLEIYEGEQKWPLFYNYDEMVKYFGEPLDTKTDEVYPKKTFFYSKYSVSLFYPSRDDMQDSLGTVPQIVFNSNAMTVFDGLHIGSTRQELNSKIPDDGKYDWDITGPDKNGMLEYEYHFLYHDGTNLRPVDTDDQTNRYRYFVTFKMQNEIILGIKVQFGYPDWLR